MRLGNFVEAAPPPVVAYSVFEDGVEIGAGLTQEAAQALYDGAKGSVTLTNQHGHCYAYKGGGWLCGDEPEQVERTFGPRAVRQW